MGGGGKPTTAANPQDVNTSSSGPEHHQQRRFFGGSIKTKQVRNLQNNIHTNVNQPSKVAQLQKLQQQQQQQRTGIGAMTRLRASPALELKQQQQPPQRTGGRNAPSPLKQQPKIDTPATETLESNGSSNTSSSSTSSAARPPQTQNQQQQQQHEFHCSSSGASGRTNPNQAAAAADATAPSLTNANLPEGPDQQQPEEDGTDGTIPNYDPLLSNNQNKTNVQSKRVNVSIWEQGKHLWENAFTTPAKTKKLSPNDTEAHGSPTSTIFLCTDVEQQVRSMWEEAFPAAADSTTSNHATPPPTTNNDANPQPQQLRAVALSEAFAAAATDATSAGAGTTSSSRAVVVGGVSTSPTTTTMTMVAAQQPSSPMMQFHPLWVSIQEQYLPWLSSGSPSPHLVTSEPKRNPPSAVAAATAAAANGGGGAVAVVTSRVHEDIEVSPGHLVRVRLPPTNPTLLISDEPNNDGTTCPVQPVVRGSTTTTMKQSKSFLDALNPVSSSMDAHEIPAVTHSHTAHSTTDVAGQNNNNNPNKSTPSSTSPSTTNKKSALPIVSLTVRPEEAAALERSISELTMRSSYAATEGYLQQQQQAGKMPENRRMAYYAVGQHHRRGASGGGNRRCYFTGKLILGGAPFYAGSVLQGLRTLVVFCLPSAVGLPDRETILRYKPGYAAQQQQLSSSASLLSYPSSNGGSSLRGLRLLKASTNGSGSKATNTSSYLSNSQYTTTTSYNNLGGAAALDGTVRSMGTASTRNRQLGSNAAMNQTHNKRITSSGASTAGTKMSRLSSLDDLSLSIDGDLDPNFNLDRDFLLKVLPPANAALLRQMAHLYPDQFETLPMQVRDATQWKLYVKFCFFSGLPISDGEMHYKVLDDIAEQVYGEEIVLSHDVMEASTGASAEILSLPNSTVMRYLRKHYAQQCSKLDDRIFQRANWERVAPEV